MSSNGRGGAKPGITAKPGAGVRSGGPAKPGAVSRPGSAARGGGASGSGGGGAGGGGGKVPTRGPLAFYAEVLRFLNKTKIPFMVGGTYAVNVHVGLNRETKDIDAFCRASDAMRILNLAREAGYRVEIEDERWIAKVGRGKYYCDLIYGSANGVAPVTDEWFKQSVEAKVLDVPVRLLPPTELIWAKAFIAGRYKYDGNDVVHVMLAKHAEVDYRKLLSYFEQHWEVLLMHVLRFRYIYPSEREMIPRWLMDELLFRLNEQMKAPTSRMKSCRGLAFSREDFMIDVTEWGFADLGEYRPA